MHFNEHLIQWNNEHISRLWDFYSRTLPYRDVYFSNVFGARILRQSGLPLRKNLKVLDFGCGPGFIWGHLQRLKSRWIYTAIDFSAESIKAINTEAQGKPRFRGAYHVSQLPTAFVDGEFHVVLLIEVVEHLAEDELNATLREISRLTKPGGILLITTTNNEDLASSTKFCPECGAVFHEWQHARSWSEAGLTNRLHHHGFTPFQAKSLFFAAVSPLMRLLSSAAKIIQGKRVNPHLMTVFTKN